MNLKEIAKMAGVSQSTVSIVLHDRDGVSDETRQRVRTLLAENGYAVRQRAEQPQQESATKVIFVKYKVHSLMVDGNPEYINRLMDMVGACCNAEGYELVFSVANRETLPGVFERINSGPFAGIILLGTEFSNDDRPLLNNVKKPIVIIDNDLVKLPITSISTHTWNSIRAKVEYLMRRGHREIGYIRNAKPTSICSECFRGFLNAMSMYDLEVKDAYIYDVDPTFEGAYESMNRLLSEGIRLPSALITNSDCLALGAIKALQEHSIDVPRNVSIVGGDNISSCSISKPQLTTCDVFPHEIGKWAVTLLKDQIINGGGPVIRLRIDTQIVERESVCDYADYVPLREGRGV